VDDESDESAVLEAVKRELASEPYVGASNLDVSVSCGCVILEGRVGSFAQKRAAERAVRRVGGVQSIQNMLEVAVYALDGDPDDDLSAQRDAAKTAVARLRGLRGIGSEFVADR
jgi:hypothetical protein